MGACCRRCLVLPSIHNEDKDTDAGVKVDAYQTLLGNYITISTLLLGFIVTGTMLSMNFTGEDNYSSKELLDFTKSAGAAALMSGVALVVALLVSGRSAQVTANIGVRASLWSMRNNTFWIGLCEILILGSLFMFMRSMCQYLNMTYMGPDICPDALMKTTAIFHAESGQGGAETNRPNAMCSSMGTDFYDAASSVCPASAETYPEACQDYAAIGGDKAPLERKVRFGWGDKPESPTTRPQTQLKAIDDLSSVLCGMDKAEHARDALCAANSDGVECGQAWSRYYMADGCVGGKQDDAKTCYKVCNRKEGEKPETEIATLTGLLVVFFQTGLIIIVVVRVLLIIRQNVAICKADDRSSKSIPLLSGTEFVEPSSDEDDSASSDRDRAAPSQARSVTRMQVEDP